LNRDSKNLKGKGNSSSISNWNTFLVMLALTLYLLLLSSIFSQKNTNNDINGAYSKEPAISYYNSTLPVGDDHDNEKNIAALSSSSSWEEQGLTLLTRNNTNVVNNKHVTLVAQDVNLTIAPNVREETWTYNGTVPAPPLRFKEGDNVTIHFINKSNFSHTIHFHGDHDDRNDGVWPVIVPNGTYNYTITASPAGVLMYHCHAEPTSKHIRMGMYGILIVDPKDKPLPPAKEIYMVMSEFDPDDTLAFNPKYYLLNGYKNQYMDYPIPIDFGDTIRIYAINIGTTIPCPFHLHSTTFKTYPSGLLDNPPLHTQTVLVGPGDAAIVEAKWKYPGEYLFHCHGIQEEGGNMGQINVGMQNNANEHGTVPAHITWTVINEMISSKGKSMSLIDWQYELQKRLQTLTSDPSIPPSPSLSENISIVPDSSSPLSSTFYDPSPAKIAAGTNVTWINNDNVPHTVTSGNPKTGSNNLFDSGLLRPSKSFSHVVDEGTFEYYCILHPHMIGTIIAE
jgi:nitrite reductase (NO-forming)